jgi:hypothetical protein
VNYLFLFAFAKKPCSLLQAASFMPRSNQKKNNELTPSSSGMQPKSFKTLTRCWVGCKNSFTFLKERHKGGIIFSV